MGEEGTGAATPPEKNVNKPSGNLAAWLTFAGVIFGGIVTIVVAIINTNKPGGPERPTAQSSQTAIAATVPPAATASGGATAQAPPPAPTEKEQDDAALTKLLTGTWQFKEYINFSWWEGKQSYAQSHAFSGLGTFTGVGKIRSYLIRHDSYKLSGVWQIRNKRLYWEIQKCDIPDIIPENVKGVDPIIRLTNDEFVFQDSLLGDSLVLGSGKKKRAIISTSRAICVLRLGELSCSLFCF